MKCTAENGQADVNAVVQEHVQKEIMDKMMSGQIPEKFKIDLPPGEIICSFTLFYIHMM